MRRTALIFFVAAGALLLATAWINFVNLEEAYGNGPPHYGRTTNMDKWSDPPPMLLVVDVVVLGIVGVLLALGLRARR